MNKKYPCFDWFTSTRFLPLLVLPPVLLISQTVMAQTTVGPGQTLNIDGTTAADSYLVTGGVLNANGAQTLGVAAQDGSTVNATGGSYAGSGISIRNSQATLSGVTVTSAGTALTFNREGTTTTGSTGRVTDSFVSGGTSGMLITGLSSVELINTQVTGGLANSVGITYFGGSVKASGNSFISGGENGARMGEDSARLEGSSLTLDNSVLEGRAGSAIVIEQGIDAQILLQNNARLLAGNGILLDVQEASTANMTVANSALEGNVNVAGNSTANLTFDQGSMIGDVLLESGSTANVTLQNNSQLTGRLNNASGVTINSGSNWTLTGNDTIGTLAMDGGRVTFGAADAPNTYYQLNVGTLAGNGVFGMKGDFENGNRDYLNVTGVATGNFDLAVAASGLDAASPQALTLVHTAAGDAHFALANGTAVDVGTFSYELAKRDLGAGQTEWYLDPTTKTISPGTQAVMALFNAPTTIMLAEDATLRSRMGELRFNGGNGGLWMRSYGNKYNVSSGSGVGYQQTQQGLSLGSDVRIADSQWLVGVMGGYSDSDLSVVQGTSGTIKSYYLGPYATWMDTQTGYYFDTALKFNRFHSDAKVGMSDGTRAKGDYHTSGIGASAEFGRNIKLNEGYFVEPYGKLSTAVIQGRNYDLDNGMQADGDRARSVLGEAGATAGRTVDLDNGMVAQPYVRAAVQHEFINNNRVTVNNDNVFNNDLSGSRGLLGAGVALAVSKDLQVHGDVEYSNGKNIEQPYGVNVGLRWAW
ncbi:outer membrane autotransporter barrel domain-containing protein [Pseudomonas sp. ok272]|uniref:autotransporter outer membrane beta-barrel domain-containing protein n=1 Tax=unclassified Pseudomonas TaxID=196821 RepID=UPI0008AE8F15|nr:MULTISPECIES: autotransporter outer membrane beta-barrel domain-containing protein [unclassified Pseudomonas]SEM74279.1 outer membrane autotransporter barrel domain-containing protein [Pseudomonas sp. ok272]SFM63026.1 outer membrane autotransporter barrel domain-containing protein [Pseudomonas sp. ok602]